jgi:phosphopantothenoylcysteine decarboxylase / phosphopantothenate---cysteine ligase
MSRRILITAGPTHEPIDPVRYIANRSSGTMGIEIARAANAADFSVTLLLGPVQHAPPPDIDVFRFETCDQLRSLLDHHFASCDVLIMAAAVADYQPAATANEKIPRSEGNLSLNLKPTPDLVAKCATRKRPDQFIVGFALENPLYLEARAREKLSRKGLDAIVANPLETMGSQRISATIITPSGETIRPELDDAIDKARFARFLIRWIDDSAPKCH